MRIWNKRSRMARNFQLLCGTAARGVIFKFARGFPLMSSQLTSFARPWSTFSRASSQRHWLASIVLADGWVPHWTAARMCSFDQAGPQSTGHPRWAYCIKSGNVGWCWVDGCGRMGLWRDSYSLCVGINGSAGSRGLGVGDGDRYVGFRGLGCAVEAACCTGLACGWLPSRVILWVCFSIGRVVARDTFFSVTLVGDRAGSLLGCLV